MLSFLWFCFFFFKQKTAYEMRISDWSSDVCSSDLRALSGGHQRGDARCRGQGDRRLAERRHADDRPVDLSPRHRQQRPQLAARRSRNGLTAMARTGGTSRTGAFGFACLALLPLLAGCASVIPASGRSEERRVGKEVVLTCISRWW